jgi:hypothetical protein
MTARRDLTAAIVMLITTLIFFWAAQEIEDDPFGVGMQPYVFPLAILYILGALTLISLFFYLGLINLFQYLLPTMLALSASLAIFGNRGIKWLVVIPVIAAIFYYVIFFGIFRLLEPTGMLLEYDNYDIFGPMQKFLRV